MRRENGTGTIQKIKNRKLRKPYKAVAVVGYNSDTGRPIRKVIGYYSKATEANEALINYSKNKDTYKLRELTFKEVYERWWTTHKDKIQASTASSYQIYYNRYISKLDNYIFSELKTIDLQEFFNKEIETWASQNQVKTALKQVYAYALKYEIVDKDYSQYIELVKKKIVVQRKVFTESERDVLFNSNDRICKALCILIYTGLRIREFLNLKVEDVENNLIFVRDSKTDAGIRYIPIHSKIKPLIDEFLTENMEYLFTWKNKNCKYPNFRVNFNKCMDVLNMEHTIHDTRHTFATMLNQVGANDVVISNLAGHSDTEITKKIYTHTDLEELENAIKLLQ